MAAKKKPVKKAKPKKKDASDKRITDLEKKLGDMGDTIGKQNEFIQGASAIINTLAYTPELKKVWDEHGKAKAAGQVQGQQQGQNQNQTQSPQVPQKPNEELARQVGGVVASQRENLVVQFEKDYGISGLKEEEKKEAQQKIANYLADFGLGIKDIPLPKLRSNLEKAYV